jgi:uncharacterized membrane protein
MAAVLRSLALLASAGASVSLFVQEISGGWVHGFVRANALPLPERGRLVLGLAAGAAVGVVLGLAAWLRGARVRRLAHLTAPLILLGFVPPLVTERAWSGLLVLTVVMAGFLLLAERLLRMAFAAAAEAAPLPGPAAGRMARFAAGVREGAAALGRVWGRTPWARRLPALLVVAGAVGYAVYMSVFTLRMHGRFQTYNFDLGQFDNLFFNALHGKPLRCTILGFDHNWEDLRNHADLVTFFLLPFYAIKPGAPTLLVIQSAALGLGAIPLYRFAARRLPRAYAAAIAFAYLLYPPTHGLQFFDIHFQPIAALFVLLVIDFVDQRRYVLCAIAFVIALSCREDIPVGLAILGTFLALSGRRVRAGLIMAASATIYFVVMRFFIMPSFGQWGFETTYKDLFPPGASSFAGVIQTMASNPLFTLGTLLTGEKLRYALQILLPLAFLPIRRSFLVASVVPGAMFTLLTTDYTPTIDISFQYSGHFLPYVFPAAALCLAGFGATGPGLVRRRAALATVVAGTAMCGALWGAIPPRGTVRGGFSTMSMRAPDAAQRQKHRDLVELHAMVPKQASLGMSNAEITHVSHLIMRTLWETNEADYLLYGTDAGDAHYGAKALASGQYEQVATRGRVALLKRKQTTPTPTPKP